MYSKMGYSAGKFLATDLSGLSYTALSGNILQGFHGYGASGFSSQEVDVRDTEQLLVMPQFQPQDTSGRPHSLSGDSFVKFFFAHSVNKADWTAVSHINVDVSVGCFGSSQITSGYIRGQAFLDMESVGWTRLEAIRNHNISTRIENINVLWGKGW